MLKLAGILGGSFDPVHNGHLYIANECLKILALEKILFIPSRNPPHRESPVANADDRLKLLQLAISSNDKFAINDCELNRDSFSYTYDTLIELKNAFPSTSFFLLLGFDAFAHLAEWYRWKELFNLCHVVVLSRNNQTMDIFDNKLKIFVRDRLITDTTEVEKFSAGKIIKLQLPLLDISSTQIRHYLQSGKKIDDLVPAAVAEYISQHRLYQHKTA